MKATGQDSGSHNQSENQEPIPGIYLADSEVDDDATKQLTGAGKAAVEQRQVPDNFVGRTIEKYQILTALGSGGMSSVYKAKNILTGKIVALKLLNARLLHDDKSIRRFQQEATAASRLSHPNLVNVFDMSIIDGQPHIVMEYLEGISLEHLIKSHKKLPVEKALHVFIQICSGLAHAHRLAIVHRDLKPSNIMLVKAGDDQEFVKIVDFGIAKLLEQSLGNTKLTSTGDIFGSPPFMSPEQCSAKPLDQRSDLYSMGCLMYQCLTGKAPFEGNSLVEILMKQVSETPPPLTDIDADVRMVAELNTIVMKCLAKNANERYQSADDLKRDLESAVTLARTKSSVLARLRLMIEEDLRNLGERLRKSSAIVFVSTVALSTLCAVFALIFWPLYGPGPDPSLDECGFALKPLTYRNLKIGENGQGVREKLASLLVEGGNIVKPEDAVDSLLDVAEKYTMAGEYSQSLAKYDAARELAMRCGLNNTLQLADVCIAEAECYLMTANSEKIAKDLCTSAWGLIQKINERNSKQALLVNVFFGKVCMDLGNKEEARQYFDRFQSLLSDRLVAKCKNSELAFALTYAADFYRMDGQFDPAERLYQNAIVCWSRLKKMDGATYNLGVTQANSCLVRLAQRKLKDADQLWQQSKINIQEGGGSALDQAKLMFILSDIQRAEGKWFASIQSRGRAKQIWYGTSKKEVS